MPSTAVADTRCCSSRRAFTTVRAALASSARRRSSVSFRFNNSVSISAPVILSMSAKTSECTSMSSSSGPAPPGERGSSPAGACCDASLSRRGATPARISAAARRASASLNFVTSGPAGQPCAADTSSDALALLAGDLAMIECRASTRRVAANSERAAAACALPRRASTSAFSAASTCAAR